MDLKQELRNEETYSKQQHTGLMNMEMLPCWISFDAQLQIICNQKGATDDAPPSCMYYICIFYTCKKVILTFLLF